MMLHHSFARLLIVSFNASCKRVHDLHQQHVTQQSTIKHCFFKIHQMKSSTKRQFTLFAALVYKLSRWLPIMCCHLHHNTMVADACHPSEDQVGHAQHPTGNLLFCVTHQYQFCVTCVGTLVHIMLWQHCVTFVWLSHSGRHWTKSARTERISRPGCGCDRSLNLHHAIHVIDSQGAGLLVVLWPPGHDKLG